MKKTCNGTISQNFNQNGCIFLQEQCMLSNLFGSLVILDWQRLFVLLAKRLPLSQRCTIEDANGRPLLPWDRGRNLFPFRLPSSQMVKVWPFLPLDGSGAGGSGQARSAIQIRVCKWKRKKPPKQLFVLLAPAADGLWPPEKL